MKATKKIGGELFYFYDLRRQKEQAKGLAKYLKSNKYKGSKVRVIKDKGVYGVYTRY